MFGDDYMGGSVKKSKKERIDIEENSFYDRPDLVDLELSSDYEHDHCTENLDKSLEVRILVFCLITETCLEIWIIET